MLSSKHVNNMAHIISMDIRLKQTDLTKNLSHSILKIFCINTWLMTIWCSEDLMVDLMADLNCGTLGVRRL